MAVITRLSRTCSLLMAFLFAYSASVQLNDPDWYLWFPLYCMACLVNLVYTTSFESKVVTKTGRMAMGLGLFLLVKVVVEDYRHKIAGIWSVDLRERVVREKIGSGLVVSSMLLHLAAKPGNHGRKKRGRVNSALVDFGMVSLVAVSYGLTLVFFAFQKDEMKL